MRGPNAVRSREAGAPEKAPNREVRSAFLAASNLQPGEIAVQ